MICIIEFARKVEQSKFYKGDIVITLFPFMWTDSSYYFEGLDLIIKNRFNQPGYSLYLNLEQLLIKTAKKCDYEEELKLSL